MIDPVIINIPKFSDTETQTTLNEFKKDIYDNIIICNIKDNLKNDILWEKRWKQIGLGFTILKYVFLCAVPILALSSPQPFFKNMGLSDFFSYMSGALSSMALGFERLSKLSENISKQKKDNINILLKQIDIKYEIIESDKMVDQNSSNDPYTPNRLKKNFSIGQ